MSERFEPQGPTNDSEIKSGKRYVDVRSQKEKFEEELSNPHMFLMWVITPLAIAFAYPPILEFALVLSIGLLMYGKKFQTTASLPFKIPQSSGLKDPHELSPSKKPKDAEGIGYFGVDRASQKELWFTNSDLRTHILMMGSTGSGKTEALLSLAFNSLSWGSGFVYVDGKGTTELYTKIFAMARKMAREDDLLVVNYMKGNKDLFGPQESKLSNTMNPFTTGSATSLTQLIVSLMDDSSGDGMWKGRAQALIGAIMQALVYLRDQKEILLDVEIIRDHLVLDKIMQLNKRRDLPVHVSKTVKNYLLSIPGYSESAQKQNETVMEQHGYLQMQFTKVLSSLADDYSHIFKTNLGEVNFWDVVVNRRILVVLLPALENSEPELANLGKIIMASLRAMMATGLGSTLEGTIQEVVEVNPTKGNTPFVTILDEYGYYAVKGSAVMPAQARSLGFCMCFAGQDYPSFKKASPEEAAAIAANCNIKICLKLEDPQETFELFKAAAGQSYVSVQSGFDVKDDSGPMSSGKYKKNKNINIDLRDRIDLRDLQQQAPGEAHIFYGGNIVRATFFYANPPKAPEIRVNYFLRVEPPDKQDLLDIQTGVKELMDRLMDEKFQQEVEEALPPALEFQQVRNWFSIDPSRSLTERAIGVLAEYAQLNVKNQSELNAILEEKPKRNDINVFSEEDRDEEDDEDNQTYLSKDDVRSQVMRVEQASGVSLSVAEERAHNLVEDMRAATAYGQNNQPEDVQHDDLMELIGDFEEILVNDTKGGNG
jgi:intracellular multiplication protein IcmO